MKLKNIALAAVLAVGIAPAFAADQTIDLSSGTASFFSTAPLLSGGSDVLTFANLAAGTYDFVLNFTTQNITGLSATLFGNNGAQSVTTGQLTKVTFAGFLESSGVGPFKLEIFGTPTPGKIAKFSGDFTVTAVPEPETYALLLAGLGVVGFVARRRRPQ